MGYVFILDLYLFVYFLCTRMSSYVLVLYFTRDPNLASYKLSHIFKILSANFRSHLGILTIFGFSENYLMKFPNIPLVLLSKTPYF